MAEARKVPEPKAAPVLARASEANDPEVHALLGQRSALQQWTAQQEEQIAFMRKEIEDRRAGIAAVDKQLADLGYC